MLLAGAAPLGQNYRVAPGEGAQERLQEALILAEPGDMWCWRRGASC